jgi:hypothetical protein
VSHPQPTTLDKTIDTIVAQFHAHGNGAIQAQIQVLPAPHQPTALPQGRQGLYAFLYGDTWLKVGKAGPKTQARWMYQHYNIDAADSNLAWSLAWYADKFPGTFPGLPAEVKAEISACPLEGIGAWIKRHTTRVELTIPASLGKDALATLERISLRILQPVFEGHWRQRRGEL